MTRPSLFAVGKVTRSTRVTPQGGGKAFIGTTIELVRRTFDSGKSFSERVEARDYGKNAVVHAVGSIVSVVGSASADTYQSKDGKPRAFIAVTGNVEVVAQGTPAPTAESKLEGADSLDDDASPTERTPL